MLKFLVEGLSVDICVHLCSSSAFLALFLHPKKPLWKIKVIMKSIWHHQVDSPFTCGLMSALVSYN